MANLATISNNILADSGIDPISVVTGSGSAGRVAYWSSSSAITGENALYWDATNDRLGIGLSTPSAALHISVASPFIYLDDTSTAGTLTRFRIVNGDIGVRQTATFGFDNTSGTAGLDVLFINELGKVGIGDNGPSSKLQVAGDVRISNTGSAIDGYDGGFLDYSSSTFIIRGQASTGGAISLRTAANGAGNISTERINIASDGLITFTSTANRYFKYGSSIGTFKFNDNTNVTPLVLENTYGFGYAVGILFNLGYGGSGSSVGTAINGAKIIANPEQSWSSTASTQDASLLFQTAADGVLGTRLSILSGGTIRLDAYSTDGFVKTSSSTGTITIDTTSYQPLLTNPVTGTGANTRIALWTGTTTLGGGSDFLYDGSLMTVGLSATSNQTDYKVLIQRHGTLANPGTWTDSNGLQVVDYSADGPSAGFIATGLVSIELPRIASSDTYAGNAVAFRIANDTTTIMVVKGNATIHLGQNGSTDTGERLQVSGAIKQTNSTSAMLKSDSTGRIVSATAGTDYVAPSALSGYLPLTGGTLTNAGGQGTPVLTINGTSNDNYNFLQSNLSASLGAGKNSIILLGKSSSALNAGYIGFNWNSAGGTDNYLHFGLYDVNNVVRLYGNGNFSVGTVSSTPTTRLYIGGTSTFTDESYFLDKVGIGTTTLNYSLNIYNATVPRIHLTNTTTGTATTDGFHIYQSGSDSYVLNKESANLYLGSANSVNLTIASTGAAAFTNSVSAGADVSTTTRYLINTGTANQTAAIGFWDSANMRIEGGSAYPMLITSYNGLIKLGPSGSATMYINGSNVGISTASPFSLLHVGTRPGAGTTNPSLGSIATVSNDGLTGIDLGANVNANAVVGHINWVNYLGVGNYNTARIDVYADGGSNSGTLRFWTASASSSPTQRMIINSSGYVGINQSTPSGILHVTSTGITAAAPSNPWPSYNADSGTTVRSIYIDTAGNGNTSTAGYGATVAVQLGQYYDSRVVITPTGAGGSSPSDQGTGRGKDLMIKGGTSDNTNGYKGGRLYLNGGIGYSASAYNANGGDILMQSITGSGNVLIGEGSAYAQGLTIYQGGSDSRTLLQLDRPNNPGLQTAIKFSVSNIMVAKITHEYVASNHNDMSFTLRSVGGGDIIPLWLCNSGNSLFGYTSDNSNGKIQVNGTIYASGDVVAYSDISVKNNIRPIENVLSRISESRGVLYDRTDREEKNNIGFIAQELEQQFPELIQTNKDGTKGVKYQNAVAILFEAVKEQQKQIDELKKR